MVVRTYMCSIQSMYNVMYYDIAFMYEPVSDYCVNGITFSDCYDYICPPAVSTADQLQGSEGVT